MTTDPDGMNSEQPDEAKGETPETEIGVTEPTSETDKTKRKKKKKIKYIDDGHTVYSMEGLDEIRGIKKRGDSIKLSRKEKWAAIRAAFARFLPIFLGVVACFSLTAVLLYFWLKG